MQVINIHEAKTNLSRLLEQVAKSGEPFIIAKAGKPMLKVVFLSASDVQQVKCLGFMSSQIFAPDDFDQMGQDEIADMFGGDLCSCC